MAGLDRRAGTTLAEDHARGGCRARPGRHWSRSCITTLAARSVLRTSRDVSRPVEESPATYPPHLRTNPGCGSSAQTIHAERGLSIARMPVGSPLWQIPTLQEED